MDNFEYEKLVRDAVVRGILFVVVLTIVSLMYLFSKENYVG